MPSTSRWFIDMGFSVAQTPGVSRAWQYDFVDGSYLLITDVGGYDLPEPGGPYCGMHLSRRSELLEFVALLWRTSDLFRWFRHVQRKVFFELLPKVPALKSNPTEPLPGENHHVSRKSRFSSHRSVPRIEEGG
jgi:hypothetical protein